MTTENQNVKCLLVDDLPENLLAMVALLRDFPISIYQAQSGVEALELSLQHEFALALIDVQMPGMNGYELAELLRGSERTRQIPLIFVTAGMRDREGVFRGYEAGAVDFLYKPIDPHILKSKVKIFIELAQQKAQLREQEELFRTTFENAAIGLSHLDLKGKWIQVNSQYCKILGLGDEDITNQSEDALTEPEDLVAELELRQRLIKGEISNFALEKRVRHKDGHLMWVKVQVALIRKADGRPDFLVSSLQDISNEKKVAENLQKAKEASDEASKTKSEFLANMSHEIRTPLTAILGFADLLIEDSYSVDEAQEFLKRIKTNGDSLLRLIEDILDLSKFESGKMPIDPVPMSLKELVDEVLSSFEMIVKNKNIELKAIWQTEVPEIVHLDRLRVRQVLVNLLSNAVKFTEFGRVTISCSYEKTGPAKAQVKFLVEDTGVGIPLDKQEQIFKPFTQADASITRKFGGTGLGLTLSRRIAQAMNGDLLLVRSVPAQGSAFQCTFQVMESATLNVSPSPEASKENPAGENEAKMDFSNRKILLAEDSADNIFLVKKYLSSLNVQVDSVANGQLAIEALQKSTYDLVLMDMQMPVLDGLQATAQIRRNGYKGPIIALTAHAMSEHVQQAMNVGCDAYLSKPFERLNLISVVKDQLEVC